MEGLKCAATTRKCKNNNKTENCLPIKTGLDDYFLLVRDVAIMTQGMTVYWLARFFEITISKQSNITDFNC